MILKVFTALSALLALLSALCGTIWLLPVLR